MVLIVSKNIFKIVKCLVLKWLKVWLVIGFIIFIIRVLVNSDSLDLKVEKLWIICR